jgi:hypothetical protein
VNHIESILIEKKLTVLDAIGAPLALGDFAKYRKPLIEKLIDDSILSFGFKIFIIKGPVVST